MGREVCNDSNYLSDIRKWTQVSFKFDSFQPGMVAHAGAINSWEAEADRWSQVWDQCELKSEILLKKKKAPQRFWFLIFASPPHPIPSCRVNQMLLPRHLVWHLLMQ